MSGMYELADGSVVVPARLFERMAVCYYGRGPRFGETEGQPVGVTSTGVAAVPQEVGEEEDGPDYNSTIEQRLREAASKPRLQRVDPEED